MEKEKKPANSTKPFPGNAQALGHGTALSPLPSGVPALLVEAQMGIHSIPPVVSCLGRAMAASAYLYVCVHIYI